MSHILIVESDCVLAKNLVNVLQNAGHSVVFTVDAQAAITAADARCPDVIILDLLLAGRSGIEFLYELRSYPDWQAIPALVYSSIRPSELSAAAHQELGIVKAFYKPLARIQDLVEEVGRLSKLTPA